MRALTVVFALLSVRICAALVLPSASRGVKLFREQSPTNQAPLHPQHATGQSNALPAPYRSTRRSRFLRLCCATGQSRFQMNSPYMPRDYVSDAVLRRLCTDGGIVPNLGGSEETRVQGSLEVQGMPYRVEPRDVPGDGACLFTSLAACLWWASFGTHPKFEDRVFLDMIDFIRQLAVDTLQDARIVALALEGDEVISRQSLVELAASGYGVSPEAYCERMRLPTTWGGGPEIIALSHALGRVIVVYEVADQLSMTRDPPDLTLAPRGQTIGYGQTLGTCTGSPDTESYQVLKIAACLGFPHNITEDPLHILFARSAACTNGIRPSGGQPADHFLPLFPCLAQ